MTAIEPKPSSPRRRTALILLAAVALAAAAYAGWKYRPAHVAGTGGLAPRRPQAADARFFPFRRFGFWWGSVPEEVRALTRDTGAYSNIEPRDYVGAQQC